MTRLLQFRLGWIFAAGVVAIPAQKVAAATTLEFDQTFAVGSERRIVIDAPQIELSVTGSDRADISMHMVWSADTDDAEEAKKVFEHLQFEPRETGEATVLKLKGNGHHGGWFNWGQGGRGPRVRMELQVPASMHLNIDATSGDVVVRSVAGDHRIDTTSASIRVEDSPGRHDLDSTSGSIEVIGSMGDHRLHTTSGDIRVEGGEGDIIADSTSGSIRILDYPGAHRADTTSGDIYATLGSTLAQDLRFDSTSGNVQILVPTGLAAQFDLDTASGHLRFDVPGAEILRQERDELSARTHDGEYNIRLDTTSGNITVAVLE